MNKTYTPLTAESAFALLVQVELIPKNRRFAFRDVGIDSEGRAYATITTNASPERIRAWFRDAGAMLTRLERKGDESAYIAWFDWR